MARSTARSERDSLPVTDSGFEQRHDPIVCQGSRLVQIDNRNLQFDGDAVKAQDGCELYITNSHIIARGTGVSASKSVVHISNSEVEGAASVSASEGAEIYTQASRFKGMTRRLDTASFHDLGETVWN
jgi:hypothetical protein